MFFNNIIPRKITRVRHVTAAAGVNGPVDFSLFICKVHALHTSGLKLKGP